MNIIFIQIIIFLIVELKGDNIEPNISAEAIEILEINDSNFDSIIQNGNNNRWLILFYLETCYHCYRARRLLNTILELKKYKEINNIKFASIEVKQNSKANIRFNITKVPYIILVENNTMLELDSYSNEKNLINFIETNFNNVTKDLIPFPTLNILQYHYILFRNSLNSITDIINDYLESKNLNIKFNLLTLILAYILFCFILCYSIVYIYFKCLNSKKNNLNKKKINSQKIVKNDKNNVNNINKEINDMDKVENEEAKKLKEEINEKEDKENKNNKQKLN